MTPKGSTSFSWAVWDASHCTISIRERTRAADRDVLNIEEFDRLCLILFFSRGVLGFI